MNTSQLIADAIAHGQLPLTTIDGKWRFPSTAKCSVHGPSGDCLPGQVEQYGSLQFGCVVVSIQCTQLRHTMNQRYYTICRGNNSVSVSLCVCLYVTLVHRLAPLRSARQHRSYDDCLDVKRKYYQNCSVPVSYTHLTLPTILRV